MQNIFDSNQFKENYLSFFNLKNDSSTNNKEVKKLEFSKTRNYTGVSVKNTNNSTKILNGLNCKQKTQYV